LQGSVMGVGTDMTSQSLQMSLGVRDGWDAGQTLRSGLLGAGSGAVLYGAGRISFRSAPESAESIIARTAQKMADRGPVGLRPYMSHKEWSRFARDPAAGSRFLGTAVHRATKAELDRLYPKRFVYNRVGPDFFDTTTGGLIELTTPGSVNAHIRRGGDYTRCGYSTYALP
jgi:hypothetical protein